MMIRLRLTLKNKTGLMMKSLLTSKIREGIALKRTSGNSRELEETPKTSMMTKAIGDTALVASKDLRVSLSASTQH